MTDFANRIESLAANLRESNIDCMFISPSSDLRYFTGYKALPLERLTCLAVTRDGDATLIVPRLELPAAAVHSPEAFGVRLVSFEETEDPFARLRNEVGVIQSAVVNDVMWAQKAFALQQAFNAKIATQGEIISKLRAVKSSEEVEFIADAGRAIDAVHSNMNAWLRAGRTEREVSRDIADAILSSGHEQVDFVIVASGPNGASAHHEVSDRVIEPGDSVVVDIGGTMPSGYCSDSTRMYSIGEPCGEFSEFYEVLKFAQSSAVSQARVGMSGAQVDAIARDILEAAGLGQYFVHRTGHGLGLDTHEDPYIVASNDEVLVKGNVYSIEPGFYISNKFGARIEDIVVLTETGATSVNNTSHELAVLN